MRRMRMRTPGEMSKQAGWRHGTRRKTRRETGREARRARRRPRARIDIGKMAIYFIMRRSHQLIAHHPSPRLSSRLVRPARLPVPSSSIIVYRLVRLIGASARPACRPGSVRSVWSPGRPVRLPFFYHPPVKTCPIHGSGLAAESRQRGWRRGFLCAVFPSSLSFVMSSGSPRRGGASSDRFRPPSWRPRRVPHHLIRLISLAPSPSLIMKGEGVRYFFFKQATRLWHPSHHGASRLGSSSHPIPIMKRLVPRLVPCVSPIISNEYRPPGINEGRVMTK